jgi:hypothetical protein
MFIGMMIITGIGSVLGRKHNVYMLIPMTFMFAALAALVAARSGGVTSAIMASVAVATAIQGGYLGGLLIPKIHICRCRRP